MRLLFSFIVMLAGHAAFSQTDVPDTFVIDQSKAKIQPFERKYIQYTETKQGLIMFNSILTRKRGRATIDEKEGWLTTQTYQQNKFVDKDSSFCELATLQPIGYYTDIPSENHKERVLFSKDGISNTVYYKDSTATAVKQNKGWYNGVITDDIISLMPLKLNRSFVIKLVNPGARYTEYMAEVKVEAQEEIMIDGIGKILCWRIRSGKGVGSSLEWYTVKGQVQVKKKFEFSNGMIFHRVLLAS